MNIAVICGRKFPLDKAKSWLLDCPFLEKGHHWRIALENADELIFELLKKQEKITLYLPASLSYVPARYLELVKFLANRGRVVFGENRFPRAKEYRDRNKKMLLDSKLLIAFWDRREGALEWAIKYAQRNYKKIIIVKEERRQ